MKKPAYFNCYLDNERMLARLTSQQRGDLWLMLLAYANRGEEPQSEDTLILFAFDVMSQQIDRDFEKYSDKCEKLRKNAQSKQKQPIAHKGDQEKEEEKEEEKEKEEENEKEKEKENKKENKKAEAISLSACADGDKFAYQPVVSMFNYICESLPKVTKLNEKRKKLIKSAYKLLEGYPFEELFKRVEASDFLTGRSAQWCGCGFDWILTPVNLIKIIEGNYDNRPAGEAIEKQKSEPQSPAPYQHPKQPLAARMAQTPSYNIEELERRRYVL